MKRIPLSVNAPLGNIKTLERAGYDCIEPSNTDIAAMEEAEILAARAPAAPTPDAVTNKSRKARKITRNK